MNNVIFTIGCDPEFFIKRISDDKIISAVGIIKGTKDNPFNLDKQCAIHIDNVALEITVTPSSNLNEFVSTVSNAIKLASSHIDNYELSFLASHLFNEEELTTNESREFGCSADYDAFDETINIPINANNTNLRSCGGHIHIGYKDSNKFKNKKIVLLMDAFLGLPSVLLDLDSKRRELYGKASCYRNKDFGLEYRVLSNFWTKNDTLIRWVYEAVEDVMNKEESDFCIPEDIMIDIRRSINTNNKEEAKKLVKMLRIKLPKL